MELFKYHYQQKNILKNINKNNMKTLFTIALLFIVILVKAQDKESYNKFANEKQIYLSMYQHNVELKLRLMEKDSLVTQQMVNDYQKQFDIESKRYQQIIDQTNNYYDERIDSEKQKRDNYNSSQNDAISSLKKFKSLMKDDQKQIEKLMKKIQIK